MGPVLRPSRDNRRLGAECTSPSEGRERWITAPTRGFAVAGWSRSPA